MEAFNVRLKQIRESRGMTVNQLAMYSGISSASISRYESGERNAPKPENIKKLSEALKFPYEELMVAAGHLKRNKDNESYLTDPQKLELFEAIDSLTDDNKKFVLEFVRRLEK